MKPVLRSFQVSLLIAASQLSAIVVGGPALMQPQMGAPPPAILSADPTKRQAGPLFGAPFPVGACGPCAGPCPCANPQAAVIGFAPPAIAAAPPPAPGPVPGPALPAPVPPVPPLPAGRLIPQALPGAPCEPGVECTGGSVCSMGICLCPPELVQEGTVCVSRTIYGVVPGGLPPPPPPGPGPVAAYPAPAPPPLPALPAAAPPMPAAVGVAMPAFAPAPYPAPIPAPVGPPPVAAAAPGCMPGYAAGPFVGYGSIRRMPARGLPMHRQQMMEDPSEQQFYMPSSDEPSSAEQGD